jgi:hypothetical protein
MLKKKLWANFQRIIEHFTQKIVTKLSKIWVWDPGPGIRDSGPEIRKKPIPDPGSRGQKGTGSRIRIRNTVICPDCFSYRFCPLCPVLGALPYFSVVVIAVFCSLFNTFSF